MSVLNDGNNLPGTLIDIESEVSQDYDPSLWGTTESVLVIGTAFQGPTGEAVRIYNADMGRYFFGNTYDTKTHRSASLVAGIQAAYDRGCRTIYAMRVGGKDIYKDFRLCESNTPYRLRIASVFPTNTAKQCYVKINVNAGEEAFEFYKPASRATISEKKQGIVEASDATIKTTILLNQDNGLTRNDKLTELIRLFNGNVHNNVLEMSIVDEDGNDMTTAPDAQELRIGSLFSGVYFIGRDKNSKRVPAYTIADARAVVDGSSDKPYSDYKGKFYRFLNINTDVSSDYPIGSFSRNDMKKQLAEVVTFGDDYDFLAVTGQADKAWMPDETDYEEAELSNYDLYERLGSGFAITAQAIPRGVNSKGQQRKPRIIETPSDSPNHTVGITDGIYSILQNLQVDYRVLVAANADDKISASLPKAEKFFKASTTDLLLLGDGDDALIEATSKVDEKDLSEPKKYTFHFKKVDEDALDAENFENLYCTKIARIVPRIEATVGGKDSVKELEKKTYPDGTLFMVFDSADKGTLYRVTGRKLVAVNVAKFDGELFSVGGQLYKGAFDAAKVELSFTKAKATDIGKTVTASDKAYMLVDNGSRVYVVEIAADGKLSPLGDLETMLSDNDAKTLIYVENSYEQNNQVVITTGAADYIPLDEFVQVLQSDSVLDHLFKFKLTQQGSIQKDEYPEEIEEAYAAGDPSKLYFEQDYIKKTVGPDPKDATKTVTTTSTAHAAGKDYTLSANKTTGYDYGLLIPYRTNDNFVRQLAQHCAYSTLRTHTTHGVIGFSPLHTLTLKGIADRAQELLSADFSLYAKKNNGRQMLDNNGNPYEIGGNVSVTAFQYPITDSTVNVTTTVNGAAGYAGMISVLPVEQSTTMQTTGLSSVDFTFSASQLVEITNAGYVVTTNSDTKGICIADGVTMAPFTEFRRRLSVVRTMNACGDAIRAAAEPFIGKINNLTNRSALKTAIDSALGELKDKLIWNYKFEIVNMSSQTSDSHIDINYEIFPMNEIRSIQNFIKISHQSVG